MSLASYLDDHPQVYVSKPKEPHYFCKDLKTGGYPFVKPDLDYLETYFPGLDESPAKAAIDCSVWYSYSRVAVEEILRFQPQGRFLVMVRNPVDMV
jgi:hypothetical protein